MLMPGRIEQYTSAVPVSREYEGAPERVAPTIDYDMRRLYRVPHTLDPRLNSDYVVPSAPVNNKPFLIAAAIAAALLTG
jgi:hypothetical protein